MYCFNYMIIYLNKMNDHIDILVYWYIGLFIITKCRYWKINIWNDIE